MASEPMNPQHPDWKDHERLRAQRIADSLKPYLRSGGLRFLPKPEDFFVWPKDLQEIVDMAAQVPAPSITIPEADWGEYQQRRFSERRIFKPETETYVIGKPTDDCDGILIARTDEAGNVSLEIA